MLSEGIKFSCDGVSYKTHESQRVRKSVLKQPRQVSVLPTLGWLPPRAVDAMCSHTSVWVKMSSPHAPNHIGHMGRD